MPPSLRLRVSPLPHNDICEDVTLQIQAPQGEAVAFESQILPLTGIDPSVHKKQPLQLFFLHKVFV